MAKELMAVRHGSTLVPLTDSDREMLQALKMGEPVKVEVKSQSARSVQHHRLFFALLQLTLDYWEDEPSLLTTSEKSVLGRFVNWLDDKSGNTGAIKRAARAYLHEVRQSRNQTIETPHKSIDALLEWVKQQVKHVEYISTPTGLVRKTKSISFASMSQEQFNDFYKRAFSVCWRFVLSRNFESEQEAELVINNLVNMG